MTARATLRLLINALVLGAAACVLALGGVLVRHVAGLHGAVGLLAWSMGFAVLLPVGLAAAAVLAGTVARGPAQQIVPNAGWKVPGAGQ